MPFSRRIRTASGSLPSVCSSARLQSIMPAPVFSRSARTCSGDMAMLELLLLSSFFGLRLFARILLVVRLGPDHRGAGGRGFRLGSRRRLGSGAGRLGLACLILGTHRLDLLLR